MIGSSKPITLLGGLTSFGGAGNNYSMHVRMRSQCYPDLLIFVGHYRNGTKTKTGESSSRSCVGKWRHGDIPIRRLSFFFP